MAIVTLRLMPTQEGKEEENMIRSRALMSWANLGRNARAQLASVPLLSLQAES